MGRHLVEIFTKEDIHSTHRSVHDWFDEVFDNGQLNKKTLLYVELLADKAAYDIHYLLEERA